MTKESAAGGAWLILSVFEVARVRVALSVIPLRVVSVHL
jgi:hypothetical protein